MKQLIRKTPPLGDAKLERLATLLGEFLARAWMKKNKNQGAQTTSQPSSLPRVRKDFNK